MNGSIHHEVRRALQIDLEEIKLLAEAANMVPSHDIRHKLLHHIISEACEAMFWNHHLGHVEYMAGPPHMPPPSYPPPYHPPYDDPFTMQEKAEEKQEKKEDK